MTQVSPHWEEQVLDSIAKLTAPRFPEAQDVMLCDRESEHPL